MPATEPRPRDAAEPDPTPDPGGSASPPAPGAAPRLAYLYSRFPVVSQTFCDAEMLALEQRGWNLVVASLNPPPSLFRHPHLADLAAPVLYPPPTDVIRQGADSEPFRAALGDAIETHERAYGSAFKAGVRARNAWALAPRLRALGVRHVHVHFANRATHSAWFLKQLGFRYSFTAHAQDFMLDLGSNDLLRELCRDAEFVVAVSDFSRDLLASTCPDAAHKIARIYNGLDLEGFEAADPGRPPADRPLRIVSIGRLIEFKGFHHLIAACARVRDRGRAVDCRIIGDGPWRAELADRIDRLQLQDSVSLLGTCSGDEVRAELAGADVFALACIVDSKGASDILPTVITEAMASRLPVVSTRLAGVPEMVDDGNTGLLVEPGDETGLADALEQLAADPALATRMGNAGRDRALRLFSREVTIPQLEQQFTDRAGLQDERQPAPATAPPRLLLAEQWDPQDAEQRTMLEHGWQILAKSPAGGLDQLPHGVWFYPDAVVLEACWLQRADQRALLDNLRFELGPLTDGEAYFTAARRALWCCTEGPWPRQAGGQVHAHRSTDALTAWLIAQLSAWEASAVIEDPAAAPRKLLEEILPAFGYVSLADTALRRRFDHHDDHMALAMPPSHHQLRLGPLRIKWRRRAAERDGRRLALELMRRLEGTGPS